MSLAQPKTVAALEELGRVRLSRSFYMRDFFYSEISSIHGIPNVPEDPEQAIITGRHLCEELLEPLQATFGRVAIYSGYRSPTLNAYGNAHKHNCASNERNYARHIWDKCDADGRTGAMASIVIPWFADRYAEGADWRAMAWWIHDHLPYDSLYFFPKLAAFNIGWREQPERRIDSYVPPKGCLTQPGMANHDGNHSSWYAGFLVLKTTDAEQCEGPET
jgi:hypothetical protein